jgi:hypothetical protein
MPMQARGPNLSRGLFVRYRLLYRRRLAARCDSNSAQRRRDGRGEGRDIRHGKADLTDAQRLDHRLFAGEVTAVLDDLPQLVIQRLDR